MSTSISVFMARPPAWPPAPPGAARGGGGKRNASAGGGCRSCRRCLSGSLPEAGRRAACAHLFKVLGGQSSACSGDELLDMPWVVAYHCACPMPYHLDLQRNEWPPTPTTAAAAQALPLSRAWWRIDRSSAALVVVGGGGGGAAGEADRGDSWRQQGIHLVARFHSPCHRQLPDSPRAGPETALGRCRSAVGLAYANSHFVSVVAKSIGQPARRNRLIERKALQQHILIDGAQVDRCPADEASDSDMRRTSSRSRSSLAPSAKRREERWQEWLSGLRLASGMSSFRVKTGFDCRQRTSSGGGLLNGHQCNEQIRSIASQPGFQLTLNFPHGPSLDDGHLLNRRSLLPPNLT